MKTKASVLSFILFVVFASLAFGQKPQKILGLAKEEKSLDYYEEQSGLWCKLTEEKPDNAEAWHYYYKAERAILQLEEPDLWTDNRLVFYQKLSSLIEKSKPHIGDQFEYYYLLGLNSEGTTSIQFLEKAYEIDPDRSEVYGWLFSYYIPLFEEAKCIDLAKRMLKANIYSDANLKWNYNALQSVAPNGVIISNGDMDGLPKWVLQYGADVRTDVMIVNKWLLASHATYKREVFQRLKLSEPELSESDFKESIGYADYLAAYLLQKNTHATYISSGTPAQFFRDHGIEDKVYLVGNTLQYSENPFDNTRVIQQNFEEKYALEYLKVNFQQHPEDGIVKGQMNLTYLPGLIHLRDHYKASRQSDKQAHYTKLIQKIAEDSGRKEEVLSWFSE